MPTEKEIYEAHADEYERLIQREDYQGNSTALLYALAQAGGVTQHSQQAAPGGIDGDSRHAATTAGKILGSTAIACRRLPR